MSLPAPPPFFIATALPEGQPCDAWTEQTLLTSLEMGGVDWPSSCRNGTCRTCLGLMLNGTVRYDIEWPGLSAEEKAEGCVLPCVAYPCSDITLQRGS
jgi:ferredoxin